MEKAPEAFRTISEVADELEVPKHVLRFWEAKFAQLKPMKRGGGRRYYRPEDVALLFGDRGHTRAAVNERIDNIVRGLLEIGVRQGEHVGVLMQTRPSALSVVAALNRLGAVAVLMRRRPTRAAASVRSSALLPPCSDAPIHAVSAAIPTARRTALSGAETGAAMPTA